MAEEDDVLDDADALEEAVTSDNGDGEELDPLAEEMLQMMEDQGEDDGEDDGDGEDDMGSQEEVDPMMGMLSALEEEGGRDGGTVGAPSGGGGFPPSIARLMDVDLSVTIELGRTKKTLEHVLNLGEQSLVELEKQVGEPVDVLVNGKLFARGEVVTVSENFGVRITELLNDVNNL